METTNLRIKIHSNYVDMPKQAHTGEWVDLQNAQTEILRRGEVKIIDLGVSIELPEGYEAIIAPRSSTVRKWHIIQANSIGIVDSEYNGDDDHWGFIAYALEDTTIPAGTRIAQFKIVKQQGIVQFTEVETLGNENRGGYGSTGSGAL